MHKFVFLLALLAASSASAKGIGFSPEATESCLAKAEGSAARAACIGKSAEACYAAVRNRSEVDEATCLNSETEWWRDRMDAAYAAAEKRAAMSDIEFAQAIAQGSPKMVDDLALMHAAWKDWSEKRCFYAADGRRGKDDRSVVASRCMMQQTATQTLLLEDAASKRAPKP